MPYLKPELREKEVVIGEYGTTVYMVRNGLSSAGSNIRMWLTDQRLILKAGLGPQRTLPLYKIVDIREEKVGFYTMVRIEFAGGHLEWFTVQNQPQFVEALRTAQAQAPEIPETVAPAASPAGSGPSSKTGLIILAIVGACVVLGFCALVAGIGGYWYFLSPH